jgi:hypothetical protein
MTTTNPPPAKQQPQQTSSSPPTTTTPTSTTSNNSRNEAVLRHLYKDVTHLKTIAAPDIVLHTADRNLVCPPRPPLRGIAAAQAYEEALVEATGGTLVMGVESVVVGEVFGCVLGVLRAGDGGSDGEDGVGGDKDDNGESGGGGDDGVKGDGGKRGEVTDTGCTTKGGRKRGRIAMPFCGVWKFDGCGRAIEHWYVIPKCWCPFMAVAVAEAACFPKPLPPKTTEGRVLRLTWLNRENAADPETLTRWLRGGGD